MQALKAPRETYEAAILPVIVVASNSDSDDVAAAFASGANDVIYKPSDFEALFARIHAHLVRRAAELEVCRLEQTLESEARAFADELATINRALNEEIGERKRRRGAARTRDL